MLTIGVDGESVGEAGLASVGEAGVKRCSFALVDWVSDDRASQRVGCLPDLQGARCVVGGAVINDDGWEIERAESLEDTRKRATMVESGRDNDEARDEDRSWSWRVEH